MATAEMTAEPRGLTSHEWWLVLLQGIASLIIGILLITDPTTTLPTLVIFLGVYWLISGIFDLVRLFVDRTDWGWRLVSGIIGIIAGLLIIRHPLWATFLLPTTLVWVLGLMGIIIGIMSLIRAFRGDGWGPGILGALSIGFGILLLGVSPLVATPVVILLGALWGIVMGIVLIVYSFRLKAR